MRVVINALNIHPGGGLTVILGLLQSLRAAKPDWTLIVLTSQERTHNAVIQTKAADQVERLLPDGSAGWLYFWQNTCLGAWLRRRHVDVMINVNHLLWNVHCPQIVYHLNLLRFQKLHPLGPGSFSERLRDHGARRAVAHAAANVFESRYLREAAETVCNRPAHNASIVYIGLPDELIALAARDGLPSKKSRRIMCITSPTEHKDNPTLIRMLAELVKVDPGADWQLDIAGGRDKRVWEPLIQIAREWNVSDRITFHGFCSQDDLTRLLDGALCLVSTSRVESFAMVALEAMARHCPPIVADCASMPESIGSAGLLASAGDEKSFAAAVLRLANSPELHHEFVNRGAQRVAGFRWKDCGLAFARVIEQLISQNGANQSESCLQKAG